jgi:hypothetical protein
VSERVIAVPQQANNNKQCNNERASDKWMARPAGTCVRNALPRPLKPSDRAMRK